MHHLGEIANNMGSLPVHLRQDVKDKGLHVEVQGLVVQEKLGQQTQVLAVYLRGVEEKADSGASPPLEAPKEALAKPVRSKKWALLQGSGN